MNLARNLSLQQWGPYGIAKTLRACPIQLRSGHSLSIVEWIVSQQSNILPGDDNNIQNICRWHKA